MFSSIFPIHLWVEVTSIASTLELPWPAIRPRQLIRATRTNSYGALSCDHLYPPASPVRRIGIYWACIVYMASAYVRSTSTLSHELCTDLHAWEESMATTSNTRLNFRAMAKSDIDANTPSASPTIASTYPYSRCHLCLANHRRPRQIREAALYLIIWLGCLCHVIGRSHYKRPSNRRHYSTHDLR